MQVSIADLAALVLAMLPGDKKLSKARLVKTLYLIDWGSTLKYEHQQTNIQWFYNYHGPYVSEVLEEISADQRFDIERVTTSQSYDADLISLRTGFPIPELPRETKELSQRVIQATSKLDWCDFMSLIYATYPIVSMPQFSNLDLVERARLYKRTVSY